MATRDLTWPDEPQSGDAPAERRRDLPVWLEPMMWTHTALTGDVKQYRRWRERIQDVKHRQAVERAPDTETRAILRERDAWSQMKTTGKLGASFGMGLGLLWTSHVAWYFAVYLGLGWPAVLLMVLPVPLAWRVGTRLWEDASVGGMRDIGKKPNLKRRFRALVKGLFRGFGAGFGFGFTLVFAQLLLSWFVSPAPTLAMELASDLSWATGCGMVGGTFGMLLAPLLAQGAPSVERAELEAQHRQALTEGNEDPSAGDDF
jgi:hypothetical protein